jgi:hypothetical protein
MDSKDEIRAAILEEMYEYHWKEATEMSRCLKFAGDHYTYRDAERAHFMAAEWVAREHRGLLKYKDSEPRLRAIQDRIHKQHESLMQEQRIA